MIESKNNFRFAVLALMVLVAAMSRLIAPSTGLSGFFNFSPVGAMALFGAAYFSKKWVAFLVPFLALWMSNLLLDNLFYARYYDGFAWFTNWEVYLAFALIVVLGSVLLQKVNPGRLLVASLSSSVLFFLVTNFFVWKSGTMYPLTGAGLGTCYVAALPFFGKTLLGDLLFVGVLFGGFEWAQRRLPILKMA